MTDEERDTIFDELENNVTTCSKVFVRAHHQPAKSTRFERRFKKGAFFCVHCCCVVYDFMIYCA